MWTPEQLGRKGGKQAGWFCFPDAGPGVTVRVDGEDPQDVCRAANMIEQNAALDRAERHIFNVPTGPDPKVICFVPKVRR